MREFQERKKWKGILYSKWSLVILVLIFGFMAHATWTVFTRAHRSALEREKAEKTLAASVQSNTHVKDQIDQLQTSKGIEEEIRRKYSVSKPGEGVAVIVDNSGSTESATSTEIQASWWEQFLNLFKL